MVCKSPVRLLILIIEDEINKVKSGEKSGGQLNIIDYRHIRVVS